MAVGKASLQRAAELNSKDDNTKPITEVVETTQPKAEKKTSTKKKVTSKETQSTTKKVANSKTSSSTKKTSKTKKSAVDTSVNEYMQDERQVSKIHSDLPVHLL